MSMMLTLQDVERAREFYARGYWRSDTLYTLLRASAARNPDRFAFRDTNTRLTFCAALQWADALAADLEQAGLRAGDRVSIWLPSRVETVLVFMACSRMGYVCNTSLHRDYTCREIVALLQRAGSAAFFAQRGYGADSDKHDIFSMLGSLPRLRKVYRTEPLRVGMTEGAHPIGFAELPREATTTAAPSSHADRIVYLAFTSGTTGEPKGVMHSDNTILANARPIVQDWGFGNDTVIYSFSPLSHNIGVVGMVPNTSVLVVINQIAPIYVSFSVPEQFLQPLKALNRKSATVLATIQNDQSQRAPMVESGTLFFINNAIDTSTGTIQLMGTFPNTSERLWPSQFCEHGNRPVCFKSAIVVPLRPCLPAKMGCTSMS